MEISLSTNEFKALSSESRAKILKLLDERNYTLSELSVKTGMAAPTIKQHAAILMDSGLIELKDEGRKWKYYALTRKGKELLNSQKKPGTNILIILSTTLLAAALGIILIFSSFNMQYASVASSGEYDARNAIEPFNSNAIGAENTLGQQVPPLGEESTGQTMIANKVAGKCIPAYAATEQDTNSSARCYSAQSEEECTSIDVYSDENAPDIPDGKADCNWDIGEAEK